MVLVCLIFSVLSTIELYADFASGTLFWMVRPPVCVCLCVFSLQKHSLVCAVYVNLSMCICVYGGVYECVCVCVCVCVVYVHVSMSIYVYGGVYESMFMCLCV